MSPKSFLLSLARECVGKRSSSFLYESADSLPWQHPDPQVTPLSLSGSSAILDPLTAVRQMFPGTMWTDDTLIVPTSCVAEVYGVYKVYGQCEISLDIPCISQYAGGLKPMLKPAFQKALDDLASYTSVSITVTNDFVLHVYGTNQAMEYAKYKLFVLLNHFYGYSIMRAELPLSQQPLVAGADRQNLLTIFQQTGVNVYMPPSINVLPSVGVNEVYFAGDKSQVVIARKLFADVVVNKTDNLVTECVISAFVRDSLLQWHSDRIDEIMCRNATFIQMPPLAHQSANLVRFMGTTKRSIENSIDSFMKLCGDIYVAELRFSLQQTELTHLAMNKCNVMIGDSGAVVYGPSSHVKSALKDLRNSVEHERMPNCIIMEQPVELMDFILGKKQGKVAKVMAATKARVTVDKLHGLNFRLRISGGDLTSVLRAVALMEDELPAEKSLYIPEVYHKQVIGQGGQAIQMLMRKYNVYMRFANTTKDKTPNVFGDTRSDNVVIRCPAKNRAQIDRAAGELQQLILELASKHHHSCIRLTRNHRRLLLSTQSNALRDIEVTAGAAITLPASETRETQLVEISGQTEDNSQQAARMLAQLLPPTDYEFRIPWSMRFASAVGPQSQFSENVATPLFLAMNAQVQAFERVQMQEDSAIYSQIVVSVQEEFEGECFDDISEVITSYLRLHNLDIVDKGELHSDIIVESHSQKPTSHIAMQNSSTPLNHVARRVSGFPKYTRSPRRAPTHDLPVSKLSEISGRSQFSHSSVLPSSQRTAEIFVDSNEVDVPKFTPKGLPARPPMASLQWNRNYDDTPVKKRQPELDLGRNREESNVMQRRRGLGQNSEMSYNGRTLHRY